MNGDLLGQFLRSHADWSAAYSQNVFCFLAPVHDGKPTLIQGAFYFRHSRATLTLGTIRTPDVFAGAVELGDYASAIGVFQSLVQGSAEIAGTEIAFICNHPSLYVQELNPAGLRENRRIATAKVYGESRHSIFNREKLDWALKAANPPFDSVADLAAHFGIPLTDGDMCALEANALNPLEVLNTSVVEGLTATANLMTNERLNLSKVTLGYRVFMGGRCTHRDLISAESINWNNDGALRLGSASFAVPLGAIVQAIACYDGTAQHTWWFRDPARAQNERSVAYSSIDPKAGRLKEFLFDEDHQRRDPAPNFEQGVATLFHLLGFSVLRVGGTRKLSDAPDIVASTPAGNIAVVECTIGYPDQKFHKLLGRVQALRTQLDHAGASGTRILPVVVTAKPRAEVQSIIEAAMRLKIYVACREDLQVAIERMDDFPDADIRFNQLANSVDAGQGSTGL